MDGLSVLRTDGLPVLVGFTCVLWGALVIAAALRGAQPAQFDGPVVFALALGGWILPVFLCSVVLLLLAIFLNVHAGAAVVSAFAVVMAGWAIWSLQRTRGRDGTPAVASSLALCVFFLVIAFLRLAFVTRTALPLYFDSAEHYRIIQALMDHLAATGTPVPVRSPVEGYYHLGYHSVLAVLAALSQVNLGRLMLVSGVIVLAALPIPLFVIPYRETGSRLAGFFAVLLGSLGWYMPGYILNWGKYPALFAAPVILFALCCAYLGTAVDQHARAKRGLLMLALMGASVAVLIQTRSGILLAMALVAWLAANVWVRRPPAQKIWGAALTLAVLIAEVILLGRSPLLSPVLDPYLGAGLWVTGLVVVLAGFAVVDSSRLAFASLLSLVFLLFGLFIPGPALASGPLLDRPLVEMVLFAPLAILGAAGLASLIRKLHVRSALVESAAALLSVAIIAYAAGEYSFYPSDCCRTVAADDLAALDWLSRAPATDGRVLIPMAALSDAPLPYPPLNAASDAGAWVLPLTGRPISSLPYWTDFEDEATFAGLCAQDVREIFVSSRSQSFDELSLQAMPQWYKIGLALPGTRIYRVTGCPQ